MLYSRHVALQVMLMLLLFNADCTLLQLAEYGIQHGTQHGIRLHDFTTVQLGVCAQEKNLIRTEELSRSALSQVTTCKSLLLQF